MTQISFLLAFILALKSFCPTHDRAQTINLVYSILKEVGVHNEGGAFFLFFLPYFLLNFILRFSLIVVWVIFELAKLTRSYQTNFHTI